MKILIVSSFNNAQFAPFITEQADALRNFGCEVEYFGVVGKGIKGYLKSLYALKAVIELYQPDIIHAHYGLCGLLSNLQRKVPVVTTYHGSDINLNSVLPISWFSMILSKHNIFVSRRLMEKAHWQKHCSVLPCGVNLSTLQQMEKCEARKRMGLIQEKKYVLFAGAFDNTVKNYPLAKEAMALVPEAELLELKGYTREQVTLLLCAVDCFLMTSHSEGSPQVIKEAIACGCPIVSVSVGDVQDVVAGVDGCYIVCRTPDEISDRIKNVLKADIRTEGRSRIEYLGLSNEIVASKLMDIYKRI